MISVNILKTILNVQVTLSMSEQLNLTKDLFYSNYNGVNPLLEDAKDLGVYEQVLIGIQNMAYETFVILAESKPEINLGDVSYFGYDKKTFESITKNLFLIKTMSREEKSDYINSFSAIIDKLDPSIVKTILMILVLAIEYQQYRLINVIAYFLHVNAKLCKE